mgnify:CR=1 FL=1
MNFNLKSIIENAIDYRVSKLNKNIFSDETSEHYGKITEKLNAIEDKREMEDEILNLITESADDGFEEGFKTACNLIHSLLIPQKIKRNNTKTLFDNKWLFDMMYDFLEEKHISAYSDKTAERMDEQENMIYNTVSKEKASELIEYIGETNSDIWTESFETGVHIGIDMMKYLMK